LECRLAAFLSLSVHDISSWLCSKVNGVLCSNLADDKFVTLFYGILDAQQHTLQTPTQAIFYRWLSAPRASPNR